MTQDELFTKHMEAIVKHKDHRSISIQYAISVLEELSVELEVSGLRRSLLYTQVKIEELKSLSV